MKYHLLLFSITLVACQSLQLETVLSDFLSELQGKITQRNNQNCQKFPDQSDQSVIGDCIRAGGTMSTQLTAAFRPIAGQEFQKLLENLDGRYYKQDPNTGLWYLPSQGKSNMTEDGIARNAEFLNQTLAVEFKKLLEGYKAYVSSDEFLISNKLKKRWVAGLGTLIRPIDDVVGSMDDVLAGVPKPVGAGVPKPVGAGVPKPVGAGVPKPVGAAPKAVGAPKPEVVPQPKGGLPRPKGPFPTEFEKMNHYDLLGVPRDATYDMIKRAYWNKAKTWHTDKVPPEFQDKAGKIMRQLNEANSVLKDPVARRQYDDFLKKPRPIDDATVRPNLSRLRASGFCKYMIHGLMISGVITGFWGTMAGLIFLIKKLLPVDIVPVADARTDIEAETDVLATSTDVEAETDVLATSTDVEAETDVVATSTDIHSETPVVNISSQVCNGLPSESSDPSTNITYYLDPGSCYYYYLDIEKDQYVWHYDE